MKIYELKQIEFVFDSGICGKLNRIIARNAVSEVDSFSFVQEPDDGIVFRLEYEANDIYLSVTESDTVIATFKFFEDSSIGLDSLIHILIDVLGNAARKCRGVLMTYTEVGDTTIEELTELASFLPKIDGMKVAAEEERKPAVVTVAYETEGSYDLGEFRHGLGRAVDAIQDYLDQCPV